MCAVENLVSGEREREREREREGGREGGREGRGRREGGREGGREGEGEGGREGGRERERETERERKKPIIVCRLFISSDGLARPGGLTKITSAIIIFHFLLHWICVCHRDRQGFFC